MFSKLRKTALKNLSEEKYRQSLNKEFETLERVIILLLYTFFEKMFCNRWVTLLSDKVHTENFLNDVLDEEWRVMLILDIFFFILPRYEPLKNLFWSNMLDIFSDKFYVGLIFRNISTKIHWKILKLELE